MNWNGALRTGGRSVAAVLALVMALLLARPGSMAASAAPAAGVPITFLVASCSPDSSMYTRVVAGQDPTSSDNGTPSAVPSDIPAYGCTAGGGAYTLALLPASTPGATFSDSSLTTVVTPGGPGITPGQSFYVVSGKAATRQFYSPQFAITGTDWPGLPFLDLQCGTDGVHNDNGDGIGWGDQAITSQAYCILYVAGAATTATPSPTPPPTATATPSPTPSPTPTATASPTPSPTATATPSPTLSPTATATVPVSSPTVPGPPVQPSKTPVTVNKTFDNATDSVVTWKLAPSADADLLVWDKKASTCTAFGGADCGAIATGGTGTFSASGNGQYLLVTQAYKKHGDSCQVNNTVDWADPSTPKDVSHLKASYKCSGTPTLGWPLLAIGFMGAAGVAWFVHRRKVATWSR